MKTELTEISYRLRMGYITEKEARGLIFELLLVPEETLKRKGLAIKYMDYGIYQLWQGDDFLGEGTQRDCHERAFEIIENL